MDAIVVNPTNDITGTVEQRKPWKELVRGRGNIERARAKLKALNAVLKADPERSEKDLILAGRLLLSFLKFHIRKHIA